MRLLASVTRTVKLNGLPLVVVGVPESTPPLDKLVPVGTVPLDTLHVFGAVPPVAVIVCEYALPTVPSGRGLLVVMLGEALIVTVIGVLDVS